MTRKCIALGDVMLRLKAPGFERLFQSEMMEATFGGGEANAAVSLSNFGWETELVTALPNNELGDAVVAEMKRFSVGCSHVVRRDGRLGTYFLEAGAAQRPAKVVYDRAGSVFSQIDADAFDWDAIFSGADWLHISGITPAISQKTADLAVEAATQAKAAGVHVSCDFNYRSKLWKYGVSPKDIMPKLASIAETVVAGIEDMEIMLDLDVPDNTTDPRPVRYRRWAQAFLEEFPNVTHLACSLRESVNASHNRLSACLISEGEFFKAQDYDITHIVDRVGTGDAFVAGLIHGLNAYDRAQKSIDFAVAAGCLKHSIPGDLNRVSVAEVEGLMFGDGAGRVLR